MWVSVGECENMSVSVGELGRVCGRVGRREWVWGVWVGEWVWGMWVGEWAEESGCGEWAPGIHLWEALLNG